MATGITSNNAFATQIFENAIPDQKINAVVSAFDVTLVRIEGLKIKRVFGTEGDFFASPDKDTGAFFIRPTTIKPQFTAFVVDEANNIWQMNLTQKPIPSDPILIKPKDTFFPPDSKKDEIVKTLPRTKSIKELIFGMYYDPAEIGGKKIGEEIYLWKEAKFVLDYVVQYGSLKGERYVLTNKSNDVMNIDEREFYRNDVYAVSVLKLQLMPGESTYVVVVLAGEQQ